ncbi:MAG: AraC family transcriptional regulator [Planctomycetota bacterium]|nr:AraC family transcriptional regulator [Planctomycetota bacterium]
MDRVCRYLTAGFLGELSQPEAARLANLSVPAFSRFFRRSTGKSFTRYVNELRIGHACRMLIETDKSVSEIAFASGFQNLSNFNRRFRELKRAGPREFRRQFAFGGVRDL